MHQYTEITAFLSAFGEPDCRPYAPEEQFLFADLGVAVIVTTQRRGNQSRRTISYRAAVYAYNRQDNLACGRHEGLSGGIGLLGRKAPLFKGKPLGLDHVYHNRTRDPGQDVMPKWMGDQRAVAAHDPGVRGCT